MSAFHHENHAINNSVSALIQDYEHIMWVTQLPKVIIRINSAVHILPVALTELVPDAKSVPLSCYQTNLTTALFPISMAYGHGLLS